MSLLSTHVPSPATHAHLPNPRPVLEAELTRLHEREPRDNSAYFFIAAHPRSGTNWLSSLLNLHPEVVCTGEFTFHDVFNGVQAFITQPGRAALREPAHSQALRSFENLVRDTMTAAGRAINPQARVFGDHTPRRLRVFLPGANYVALFRDGRDVVVSWTFNALARKELHVIPASCRGLFLDHMEIFHAECAPSDAACRQQDAAKAMLSCEPWVRHVARQWATLVRDDLDGVARIEAGEFKARVLSVRYEDFHPDPVPKRDDVLRFLGADPATCRPPTAESRTRAGFQAEAPASHYRRGAVGDWREKLSTQATGWIEHEAGTLLAILGYR